LRPADSRLCPNFLHGPSPTDAEWNAAIGISPWWTECNAPAALGPATPVPTMRAWALLLLGLLLAGMGARRLGARPH
jgi:hypothetical protein